MAAKKVKTKTVKATRAEISQALKVIKLNSALVSRAAVASALGQSFGGKRDLYETLGYKKILQYSDYFNAYDRDGLATRIVDAVSDETWRLHPVLSDVNVEKTEETDEPSELQTTFSDLADRLDLWSAFNDADAACGISRFSLIYLGLPGRPDDEIEEGLSLDDLKFVSVHDEGSADIARINLETNIENERFSLPIYYNIKLDEEIPNTMRVHWSRVIHIKEGRSRSRIYGVPRLKKVFNRIQDLEKTVGSSSEAFYQLIYRGMALEAREGYSLPDKDSVEYKAMQDELDEYEHGLRRFLRLAGMEAKDLGGKPIDGREQFDSIITYLSGASNIPQRILVGSERGNLASSQDDYNFNDYIVSRQNKFAEPYILRAFIKRLGDYKLMVVPKKYNVTWPSLFSLTEKEQAELASTVATALYTITGGSPETAMPTEIFTKKYLGYAPDPEEEMERIEEALSSDNSSLNRPSIEKVLLPYDVNKVVEVLGGGNGKLKKALKPVEKIIEDALQSNNLLTSKQVRFNGGLRLWHNEFENSAMIAFRIPDNLRDELQKQYPFMDDETKKNLHITLVYIGDNRTLDAKKANDVLLEFSQQQRPIKTKLQGLARFLTVGDKDAVVCTFDYPDFPELFERLCGLLDAAGIPYHEDHGFIPHMTLCYIDPYEDMPIETVEPIEMNFSSVYFVNGREWTEFELNGKKEVEDGQY